MVMSILSRLSAQLQLCVVQDFQECVQWAHDVELKLFFGFELPPGETFFSFHLGELLQISQLLYQQSPFLLCLEERKCQPLRSKSNTESL